MSNPDFRKPIKHHNCRRAPFHDYKATGEYMITISKAPECPDFSTLTGDPRSVEHPPCVELSDFGKIITRKIEDIPVDWPMFEIYNHVVMPDHLHLMWKVKERLKYDLGHYVGLFKSRCTGTIHKSLPGCADINVFKEKYNDRIAFTPELAERFSRYISDNPRRRLTVMLYPQLFSRAERVRILDREFDVYGNFQLLKHPMITPAIVSSRYTPEQKERLECELEDTKRNRGVFISPFISAAERELKKEILEAGGSIIRIVADGIGPKYKPSGDEFELCAQGRCLHIGLPRPSAHKEALKRRLCLDLNDTARWIAAHPAETLILIGRTSR